MRRETILIGRGREISTVSREEWELGLASAPQYFATKLSFMTAEQCGGARRMLRLGAFEPLNLPAVVLDQRNQSRSKLIPLQQPQDPVDFLCSFSG